MPTHNEKGHIRLKCLKLVEIVQFKSIHRSTYGESAILHTANYKMRDITSAADVGILTDAYITQTPHLHSMLICDNTDNSLVMGEFS